MISNYQGSHTFCEIKCPRAFTALNANAPFYSSSGLLVLIVYVHLHATYDIKQQYYTLLLSIHFNKNLAPVFLGVSTFLTVFTIPWHL